MNVVHVRFFDYILMIFKVSLEILLVFEDFQRLLFKNSAPIRKKNTQIIENSLNQSWKKPLTKSLNNNLKSKISNSMFI